MSVSQAYRVTAKRHAYYGKTAFLPARRARFLLLWDASAIMHVSRNREPLPGLKPLRTEIDDLGAIGREAFSPRGFQLALFSRL
jgi:hypothetical protein